MFKKRNHTNDQISIEIIPKHQILNMNSDQFILDALIASNIDINHSCGGMGTCGTCQIEVVEKLDKLPPKNDLETLVSEDRQWPNNFRLSCQICAVPGLKIKINHSI